jgi:hypothetical protein
MDPKVELQTDVAKCIVLEATETSLIGLKNDGDIISLKPKQNMRVGAIIYYFEEDLVGSTPPSIIKKVIQFRTQAIGYFSFIQINFYSN